MLLAIETNLKCHIAIRMQKRQEEMALKKKMNELKSKLLEAAFDGEDEELKTLLVEAEASHFQFSDQYF